MVPVTPNRPAEPREPATAADTDTALRTADVLWSHLRTFLTPEAEPGWAVLYEQMYAWMLDEAEARAATPPALDVERLAETNGKDWY